MKKLKLNDMQLGDYVVVGSDKKGFQHGKVNAILPDRLSVLGGRYVVREGQFYPLYVAEKMLDLSFYRVTRKTWVINGEWQIISLGDGKYGVGKANKIVETFPVEKVFEYVHEFQHFIKEHDLKKLRVAGLTLNKARYYEAKYGKTV